MKFQSEILKSTVIALVLYAGASMASATTLTVGPRGQYATPCAALLAATDGDTVLVDANHGIPYTEPADPNHDGKSDCGVTKNNLTIRGVNGQPILDAAGELIEKGILVLDGHDIVVDNFELRNAQLINNPNSSSNAAGIRIEDGAPGSPAGGNITLLRCYIHDNGDGVLSGNSGPGIGQWFSPNPFLLFEFDKFYHNGYGDGQTHNMYIGYDGYLKMKFTLQYSESLNAFVGHTVKTRAPFNNILYNRIGDSSGNSSYILDFPLGGTTYVEGNVLFKSPTTNPNSNENLMVYRDVSDNTPSDPDYGLPNEDLHFLNNIVADNNPSGADAFVVLSCADPSTASCSVPTSGPVLTTPAVIENNLFIGQPTQVTNQPNAVVRSNQVLPFSHINADRYMVP
jgi:hypothetical protein